MISGEPVYELSGPHWCERFPGGRTTASLVQPFRRSVIAFIQALELARCRVSIAATWRPPERAYLMRYCWDIHHHLIQPELVPARDGVYIRWEHPTPSASLAAAEAMVHRYGLRVRPSLTSRHTEGRAVDMTVTGWEGRVVIDGRGKRVRLDELSDLHQVGRSYGVLPLVGDPVHWSEDGR